LAEAANFGSPTNTLTSRDGRIGSATQRQDEGEVGLPSMTSEEFEAIYRTRKVTALESAPRNSI
jgi:hypothetical protein